MKSGASGMLGFLLGVAVTALVANVLIDRGEETAGAEPRAAQGPAEARELHEARSEAPARAARPIEVPSVAVAAPSSTAPTLASDRIGILVYGTVSDTGGAAVSADYMMLQFTPEAQPARNAIITAEGTYAATGLQPGPCRAFANLVGYRPWRRDLVLRAEEPAVRLDVVLERADILAIKAFTRDGRPLLDALKAEMPENEMWSLRVSALASLEPIVSLPSQIGRGWNAWGIGNYRDKLEAMGPLRDRGRDIPPDAMGLLELDVPPPVFVTLAVRRAILASQRVEPGQQEVVFTVDVADVKASFGSLSARLVDAGTRAPLPDARVDVNDAQGPGSRLTTGADGRVRLESLRPGRMRFEVDLKGYERLSALVDVPVAGHVDLGDVQLAPSRTLEAMVLDEQGQPVSGAVSVQNLDPPQGLTWDTDSRSWVSEPDGSLKIEGLGQHHSSLALRDKNLASQPLVVDMTLGDVAGVVLRAVPSVGVSLRLDWPENVRRGLRVTAASGHIATNWSSWPGGSTWTARVAPGTYVAEIYDDAKVLLSRGFDVGATPVALTLTP
jgi:hypothetical protein